MQKICLTLFFLLSQCSIYDLSQNLRLEEILTAPGIKLVSPSINSTIFADSLDIDVAFQNVAQGIKELHIVGATLSSNITFSSQTKRFSLKMSIPLTNNDQYSASEGIYPITLKLIGGDNSTIESNFIIPIKIKSVHTNSTSIIFPIRPTTQDEWNESSIKITPLETGAKIKNIKAVITGGSSTTYITNIASENGYSIINIALKDIQERFINTSTPLSIDLEITSENQGIITTSEQYGLTLTTIALVKPSTTTTTITDSIDFTIELTNLVNRIKTVKLSTPSGTFSTSTPSFPKAFTYTRSIQLSNSDGYNTASGKYNVAVIMTDKNNKEIRSNYVLPVKIKSVHTNTTSIIYPDRPLSQPEWVKASITINPIASGAGIKSIIMLVQASENIYSFETNINLENSYNRIDLKLKDLNPELSELLTNGFKIDTTIVSVNEGFVYSEMEYGTIEE